MLYTGVTAKLEVGIGTVAHISGFSIDISSETIEALSLGQVWKEKVSGSKDWTASADGSLDTDTEAKQQEIIEALIEGAVLPVTFYISEAVKFNGNALVESVSISTAADGKTDISISLSGSGALTPTYA